VASSRPRAQPATAPGHVWAYDFVVDACADGKQLECLTVVDEWTREALAIDVAGSIRSARVIDRGDAGDAECDADTTNHPLNCGKGAREGLGLGPRA
jgi:transposase InsO family protein